MTFPNVKNDAGKHKSTIKSVFFFEGVAGLWPATLIASGGWALQTDIFWGEGRRGSNHKPTKATEPAHTCVNLRIMNLAGSDKGGSMRQPLELNGCSGMPC